GKFLRSSRFDDGSFTPGDWRGTSLPEMAVRGMYFATHFHNFYHDAPIEKVKRYVEEMALWGCNALCVWFDMHHYTGIDDPKAQEMIKRLHAILRTANSVGMGAGLFGLANEAYADSPKELRAVPAKYSYGVELCPNKPGATELMLKWRQEMLDAFSDLDIEYFCLWPYDQGGCVCEACLPWGANGFLKIGKQVAQLVRKTFPKAKTIFSTWCFDHTAQGEYEGMWKAFAGRPEWANYILVDSHFSRDFPQFVIDHDGPANLPILNFPEISMHAMAPWGGFGTNPQPKTIQKLWDASKHLLSGGFPYSEGIYEDINKALFFQLYWDPKKPVTETVREYAAYEYSPDVADEITQAIEMMEASQQHGLKDNLNGQFWQKHDTVEDIDTAIYSLPKAKDSERYFGIVQAADAKLPARARQAWRWRILWLRAALDAELHRSQGKATKKSEEYFEELTNIYHAENGQAQITPPSLLALKRLAK
ncbi:MAG: hypothetical protein KAU28_02020, partial [Phycisphaerae bacterium]|nr:hypothetical protein [Phycisphaerae bacterium]